MYVAIKDIDFPSFDIRDEDFHISKGEVWMLKQITFSGRIWLNKNYESETVLQITQEQLESDFVEVNLNEVRMDTIYEFNTCTKAVMFNGYEIRSDTCTKTVMLNGYEVRSDTFGWAFDDFCEFMGYPLNDWIH